MSTMRIMSHFHLSSYVHMIPSVTLRNSKDSNSKDSNSKTSIWFFSKEFNNNNIIVLNI